MTEDQITDLSRAIEPISYSGAKPAVVGTPDSDPHPATGA